jgi:hypothetical protein
LDDVDAGANAATSLVSNYCVQRRVNSRDFVVRVVRIAVSRQITRRNSLGCRFPIPSQNNLRAAEGRSDGAGHAAESPLTYSPVRGQELPDRCDCALIDIVLHFAAGLELGLGDEERMISSLDDVQLVHGSHLVSDIFEQVERAERIASALHKEDRCPQRQKHFVAQLRAVTGAAERIAEAHNRRDFLFESKMTSNSRAHAFAD